MKLKIGYFYAKELNLYGDNGNVEILSYRARKRGIDVDVVSIGVTERLNSQTMAGINLVFMGGGPDSGQKNMYMDLIQNKGPYVKEFVENYGVGLFICGSYQLLGKYYKAADGSVLDGLSVFDLYTEHFGNSSPRCIGNVVCDLSPTVLNDPVFESVNTLRSNTLVGFENHGGRTFLTNKEETLAKIRVGHGNNSKDKTEGILYKNSLGSYLHGPILSKNSHLADFLITKALKVNTLPPLDDDFIKSAHTASEMLKK